MKTHWIDQSMTYDGAQLHSLFAYLNYNLPGDSMVSWRGPCDIPNDKMVDGEDLLAHSKICGSDMLHFIIELFDMNLAGTVAFQRLVSSIALELLLEKTQNLKLKRYGDDIFLDKAKLSISIASKSPVSCMIHFAMNIDNKGTPVETLSLNDLKVNPKEFAQSLMDKVKQEWAGICFAKVKVKALN